jgi:spore maturation protein CgeB
VHRPVSPVEHYGADLSYLGTFAADRQQTLMELFVEPARLRPEQRFLLGGAQYPDDFPWCENVYFVRHLPPSEHPGFFSSSRLTLNVTRRDMAEMGWCPSGRLFEATACGTPVLSDVWDGLDAFFTAGTEILVAGSTEEAVSALDVSEGELRRVAAAGRERTLAEHTSDRRANDLLRAVERAYARPPELEPVGA